MKRYFAFIVITGALLFSCKLFDFPSLGETQLSEETSPTQANVENSTEVTPEVTLSTTLQVSPEVIDPICVPSNNEVDLGAVEIFDDYSVAILGFLNRGGTRENLDSQLYNAGVANQPVTVAFADMTGDSKDDIVVSIFNPQSTIISPGGTLMVFVCQNGQFTLALELKSEDFFGAPGIRYLEDLDADNQSELISGSPTCGAHTCFEDVRLWVWTGAQFENQMIGNTIEIPYPDIRISDEDLDGYYQLELVSGGYGSAGAGVQRASSWVWRYDLDLRKWVSSGPELASSTYRIHVLHDADEAVRTGDYQTALVLYQRVIHDTTLSDWIDPEVERANLSAYAFYKTVVVYYALGNNEFAELKYDEMVGLIPVDSAAYAYVRLTDAFRDAYITEGLESGCAYAQDFARQEEDRILVPLGPTTFGYANPLITLADLCP